MQGRPTRTGTAPAPEGTLPEDEQGPAPLLDLLLGLAFVGLGVVFWTASANMRVMIPNTVIGPALLPRVCATVFAGLGLILALRALAGLSRTGLPAGWRPDPGAPAVLVPVLLGLVVLGVPWLGFLTTSVLAGTVLMAAQGARWPLALAVSIALAAVIYLSFSQMMRIPLPRGALF